MLANKQVNNNKFVVYFRFDIPICMYSYWNWNTRGVFVNLKIYTPLIIGDYWCGLPVFHSGLVLVVSCCVPVTCVLKKLKQISNVDLWCLLFTL